MEQNWQEILTPEQYRILRLGQTERGASGALLYHFEDGLYHCAGCDRPLFHSDSKYDSGTGWPAFSNQLETAIELRDDPLHGMKRLEALCGGCGGHLGHLFDDLDSPTGERFCINSLALTFQDGKNKESQK